MVGALPEWAFGGHPPMLRYPLTNRRPAGACAAERARLEVGFVFAATALARNWSLTNTQSTRLHVVGLEGATERI